jgi:lipopolysaccharide export system protein LptC
MHSATHGMASAWRSAWRAWDAVSIYLPVLLMGLLALGTYWLVRNSPAPLPPRTAQPTLHEPDYSMRNFTIRSFDEKGQLKSEVRGASARHYPDTDILEIDQPRVRSLSQEGRLVTSSGKRGLSNGDGSEVQLIGQAQVVREAGKAADGTLLPRLEFTGEFLHAYVNEERVKSHLPVVLRRGDDQFSGDTLAFDNLAGVASLQGRVRGVLQARAAGGPRGAGR